MPDIIHRLHIGDKRSVLCGDGILRTGAVVYIHPEHRFAVLEFQGVMGPWRESFLLRRPELEINRPVERHNVSCIPHRARRLYSVEEDHIISSEPTADAAKTLGRSKSSILNRRKLLRERNKV